jgi:hypothetical protein
LKHKQIDDRAHVSTLDEQASSYLRSSGATSVAQLYDALRARNPSLSEMEVTDLVWRLVDGGHVEVEDMPPATKSLSEYLRIWERNLWLYGSLTIGLIAILAIYVVPSEFPIVALRWIAGTVFVLFIPGYVITEALFPRGRDLGGIERFALSIGLSLALVPLIGLLLDYTPWGIRLTPVVISLIILTIGLSIVALARRFALSLERYRSEALA